MKFSDITPSLYVAGIKNCFSVDIKTLFNVLPVGETNGSIIRILLENKTRGLEIESKKKSFPNGLNITFLIENERVVLKCFNKSIQYTGKKYFQAKCVNLFEKIFNDLVDRINSVEDFDELAKYINNNLITKEELKEIIEKNKIEKIKIPKMETWNLNYHFKLNISKKFKDELLKNRDFILNSSNISSPFLSIVSPCKKIKHGKEVDGNVTFVIKKAGSVMMSVSSEDIAKVYFNKFISLYNKINNNDDKITAEDFGY